MTSLSRTRSRLALLALSLGGFGIGATEFVAMGLLPEIARDLLPVVAVENPDGAIARAGWLISAYALGVVIGAPTIAGVAARLPRKRLLLALVAGFTVATIASAILPTFGLVLIARVIAGLGHGAFFGVASLVAADLLGPGKRGQGVAIVLSGLTIANVVGVPIITLIGQAAGWRVAYGVVAAIFAVTFVAIARAVPYRPGDPGATMKRELSAFTSAQVWVALLVGAVGFGGFFAVYTYVAPIVTGVTGLQPAAVAIALVCVGVGMTIGNLVGGKAADMHVTRAIFVSFAVFAASLLGFALTAEHPVGLLLFLFLIGASASALSPAIQTKLMDVAGDSQTIAAAVNHAALNLGNSLGAWIGSMTIVAGFGLLSPAWAGLALCVPGIALAVLGVLLGRRAQRRHDADALLAQS